MMPFRLVPSVIVPDLTTLAPAYTWDEDSTGWFDNQYRGLFEDWFLDKGYYAGIPRFGDDLKHVRSIFNRLKAEMDKLVGVDRRQVFQAVKGLTEQADLTLAARSLSYIASVRWTKEPGGKEAVAFHVNTHPIIYAVIG